MSTTIYYVPLVPPIRLRDLDTGVPLREEGAEWTQRRYFIECIAGDGTFGQGQDADFAVAELMAILVRVRDEKLPYYPLTEGLWRRCKKVIAEPMRVSVPTAKFQLLPFTRAILDAPDELPKADPPTPPEEKPVNGAAEAAAA